MLNASRIRRTFAVENGLTQEEPIEAITHVTLYAGWAQGHGRHGRSQATLCLLVLFTWRQGTRRRPLG